MGRGMSKNDRFNPERVIGGVGWEQFFTGEWVLKTSDGQKFWLSPEEEKRRNWVAAVTHELRLFRLSLVGKPKTDRQINLDSTGEGLTKRCTASKFAIKYSGTSTKNNDSYFFVFVTKFFWEKWCSHRYDKPKYHLSFFRPHHYDNCSRFYWKIPKVEFFKYITFSVCLLRFY